MPAIPARMTAGSHLVSDYTGTFINAELAAGKYEVRRFVVQNGTWVFQATDSFEITKDGWEYNFGCGK